MKLPGLRSRMSLRTGQHSYARKLGVVQWLKGGWTDTRQSEREKGSALWLVGAETPAYTAWLRAYARQLLPDTVGLVERGDPARYREADERPHGEAGNGSDRKGGDAQGHCLRWPERTDARIGSYGRYRAVGMNGSFVWA